MSKQLNVNLQVDADVSRAKAQFEDLQNTLRNLASTQVISPKTFNTQHLKEGVQAAKELQSHLRAATDVNTGKLNLSAFSASLKSSGKSLSEYKTQLERLGPTGQDAFLKVSKSIATADAPLRQTNKYLTEFATTLKNTARWQISSSLLHGFMGTVSSAVGYAKDLNKSLTDIRIVTGQNTEQMAEFAEKANKAAKALSTTTNQYAKASLIYFQQGLEGQEVQDRADITIKMAHASGQSAEIVSDQLTAVWNNFAKGGENLEHYADVMTALGAATASSSDEIAGGLEKFASIAEMIGLSYEYAASALATITATTRQSEDVVGTALKTIFARIQGLNLGETLDDGTTLNKYSQALEKVGISIFEQNGELKKMDDILNEMGAKWDALGKDQQVALAQTVAGVRQYNQLVSLMDNWDFMQENVDLSLNSDGTLQEQADIYEESWKAASDRVRASLEGVYDSLLDDDFFITLTNGFAKLIEGVEGFADGLGGMEGVVSIIGGFITQKLAKEAPVALNRIHQNLLQITGQAHQIATDTQNSNIKFLTKEGESARFNIAKSEGVSATYAAEITGLEKLAILKQQYIQYSEQMNSVEKANAEVIIQTAQASSDYLVKLGVEYDKLKAKTDHKMDKLYNIEDGEKYANKLTQIRENYEKIHQAKLLMSEIKTFDKESMSSEEYAKKVDSLKQKLISLGMSQKTVDDIFKSKNMSNAIAKATEELNKLEQEHREIKNIISQEDEDNHALAQAIQAVISALKQEANYLDKVGEGMVRMKEDINNIPAPKSTISQSFTQMASAAMQFNAVLSSMRTFKDVFSNEDATTIERVSAVLGVLTTVMFFHNSVRAFSATLIDLETKAEQKSVVSKKVAVMASKSLTVQKLKEAGAAKAVIATAEKQALANAALKVSYLSLFAAIAAIAAVIWLVKEAYDAYQNSTPEAQLERLNEEADKAANNFKEVKSAYEDMMNTIESYNGKTSALMMLSQHSENYKSKLLEANEAALHLIDTLNLVQGTDYSIESSGRIKIEESSLKAKEEEKYAQLQQAQSYSLWTKSREQNAKLKMEQQAWGRDQYGERIIYEAKTEGDTGVTGREIKVSEAGELGSNIINKIAQEYIKSGSGIFADEAQLKTLLGDKATDELINALQDSDSEIRGLVESTVANTEALLDNTAALTIGANSENEEYQDLSDRGKGIASRLLAQKDLNQDYTEFEKEEAENYYKNLFDDSNKLKEEVAKLYGLNADDIKVQNKSGELKVTKRGEVGFNENDAETVEAQDFKDLVTQYFLTQYSNENAIGRKVQMSEQMKAADYGVEDEIFNTILEDVFVNNDLTSLNLLPSQEEIDSFLAYLNKNGEGVFENFETIKPGTIQFNKEQHDKLQEKAEAEQVNSILTQGAADYDLDIEELEIQAKQLEKIYEAEGLTATQAAKLAIENQRMNKGVKELSENWEDWNKELVDSAKGTPSQAKAIKELTKTIADLTGASEDLELPAEFFDNANNLKLIEKAAQGSEQAIAELGVAVGKASVEMMKWPEDIGESMTITPDNGEKFTIDMAAFQTAKDTVMAGLDELQSKIATGEDLTGQSLDQILGAGAEGAEGWVESLNTMAAATGMSVQEMNSLLGAMGLEANVKTTYVDQEVEVPEYEVTKKMTGPFTYRTSTNLVDVKKMPGKVAVAQISTDGSDPGTPNISYTGNGPVSPSSVSAGKGGGGGSNSKPAEEVDFTEIDEVVDRYKEIDDTLSDIEDTMSDINKQADRLYGASRLNQMKKEKDLLLQQADALKTKKLQAENYMYRTSDIESQKGDKQKLVEIGAEYGITWEIDTEDGDILNYTSVMEGLFNELYAAEVKMDGMATKEAQDEFKESTVSKIEEKIEKVKNALSKYEDTKELIKELDNQLQEAIWAWQDKNFEELEYKLELKLDIEDADLKHLDYLMNKWSDDFFQLAESAALMYSKNPNEYDQVEGYGNQLENYKQHEQELAEQYKNGEISQAKYIEGLKNVRDGYYDNLNALIELDKQMMHYYEDSLSAGKEELDDFTDHMQHLTGVFDHYVNLMDILGNTKDYKTMGDFLSGKAETLEDQLKVSKDYYEILVEDKARIEKELNEALRSGSEDDKKYWKEQWDAIVDAVDEAQDEMLSLTEEWASSMREVIQNNMTKLADDLEKALTGGIGFESLMNEFDMLNTRQEEYLTKTNQIYETNKLIRQASQKVDQTDNKVAKQKMQNFIEETKSLQENNKLSEYELEIQQAKYDLLLAEIALEEAQNAKSTVRLSRDSEGNFGYVYTADQDAVSDAEQELDDAENRLYNLSLEGQQNYTEKYLQAMEEMNGKLAELYQKRADGEIATDEEMYRQRDEILNHYFGEGGVFQTYSYLYNVAVQTDAAATADYWGAKYGEMTQYTEDWQIAVNDYIVEVEDEIEEWQEISEEANEIVEGALKDTTTATKDLTTESGNLSKKIRNELLPAMEDEYDRIIKNTIEYGKERDAILEMIAAYERYLRLTDQEIKNESNKVINDNDDYSKKDYSLSALINAANGDMDAAYQDINKRNEKIKDDENYTDKTSSTTKKKVEAIEKLSDSQKESIAKSLKYLEEQGKYTTDQVDIILKQNGASFDTGGYTGAWGPEGKLAFLHQKELVLNADDTENLLKTITFIHDLVNMIDSQAALANLGAILSTPGFTGNTDHNFEQNVSIYAEFPSATNHSEIEEAFNNLLNTASQYANRKV